MLLIRKTSVKQACQSESLLGKSQQGREDLPEQTRTASRRDLLKHC